MSSSAVRCSTARFLPFVVLLALSCEVGAQPDAREALQEQQMRIIQEQQRRIEALEKEIGQRPAPPAQPAADPAPQPAAAPPPPPPPHAAEAPKPEAPKPEAPKPEALKPDAPKPEARKPEAPAPTESEEAGVADEGARALERALVREGGLVLPRGVTEVEPRLQYTYRGIQGLNLVTINGAAQVAPQDLRRNEFEASVAVRRGLRGSLQVEARLPYVWIDQNRATASALGESERTSGWGDIELSLTKQLATARRGGVLGSLMWKSASGEHEPGRVSPGSGFHQLQAGVTAVTREDPLVFFLAPSYSWVFEREKNGTNVDPGDTIGLKAGTLLAASPETSLRASFELTRSGRTRIAGADVPGSDTTVGILEVGLAKTLSRRTLLDVQLGMGLTPDAPDFRIRLAVPIRFGP
jgi:hypothetical protein